MSSHELLMSIPPVIICYNSTTTVYLYLKLLFLWWGHLFNGMIAFGLDCKNKRFPPADAHVSIFIFFLSSLPSLRRNCCVMLHRSAFNLSPAVIHVLLASNGPLNALLMYRTYSVPQHVFWGSGNIRRHAPVSDRSSLTDGENEMLYLTSSLFGRLVLLRQHYGLFMIKASK